MSRLHRWGRPRESDVHRCGRDEPQIAAAEAVIESPETDLRRRYVTHWSVSASTNRSSGSGCWRRIEISAACAACAITSSSTPPTSSPMRSRGEPRVSNGLSLCRLHHAAFDCHINGVSPDYQVEVRLDVLDEIDGPMLKHGLQGFHGTALHVPTRASQKPDRGFLEERYARFKRAS